MSASTVQTLVTNGSPLGYANALYSPGGFVSPGPVVLRSAGGEARLTEVDYPGLTGTTGPSGSPGYPAQSVASLSARTPPKTADTNLGAGVCVTNTDLLYAPSFHTYSGAITLTKQPFGTLPNTPFYQWGEGQQFPNGPPIYPTPSFPNGAVNDLGMWALTIQGTLFSPSAGGGVAFVPYVAATLHVVSAQPPGIGPRQISVFIAPAVTPQPLPADFVTGYEMAVSQDPGGELLVAWGSDSLPPATTQVFTWTLTRLGRPAEPV